MRSRRPRPSSARSGRSRPRAGDAAETGARRCCRAAPPGRCCTPGACPGRAARRRRRSTPSAGRGTRCDPVISSNETVTALDPPSASSLSWAMYRACGVRLEARGIEQRERRAAEHGGAVVAAPRRGRPQRAHLDEPRDGDADRPLGLEGDLRRAARRRRGGDPRAGRHAHVGGVLGQLETSGARAGCAGTSRTPSISRNASSFFAGRLLEPPATPADRGAATCTSAAPAPRSTRRPTRARSRAPRARSSAANSAARRAVSRTLTPGPSCR